MRCGCAQTLPMEPRSRRMLDCGCPVAPRPLATPPPAEPMRLLPISSPRQRRFASTTGVRRRSRCRGWRQTALSVRTLGGLDRLVASWLHALGVLRGGSIESSPHMPGVAARNSGPGSNCSRRMADTVPYMDAAWARILYCSRRGT